MGQPQGRWVPQTQQYSSGEDYFIGKVQVGSAFYNSTGSRAEPNKYSAAILLPGIKQPAERYATLEQAKARLERAVAAWFGWLEEAP